MARRSLLDSVALLDSSVVANNAMNRGRRLRGSNGYDRELGFDPLRLLARHARGRVLWTDLCCGTGRALVDAAAEIAQRGLRDVIRIEGVDLVDFFHPNPHPDILTLRVDQKLAVKDFFTGCGVAGKSDA